MTHTLQGDVCCPGIDLCNFPKLRRTPMPCKLATCCIGIKIAANIKFMTWRSPMNAVLLYCIAGNFRQRKISSKATVRQFVRNFFSSSAGLRSFALWSFGGRSFAYRISSHSWKHFLFNTCGYWKISQEFNLFKKLLLTKAKKINSWRKFPAVQYFQLFLSPLFFSLSF